MNKNTLLYAGLIIFGLAGAFIFPAYKLQLSFLYILIVLAMTWDVQGGQMGYNTFGNILFFGVGMYVASSTQIAMFFSLAEWTDAGGEKTFVHTIPQFFQGFGVGILFFFKSNVMNILFPQMLATSNLFKTGMSKNSKADVK